MKHLILIAILFGITHTAQADSGELILPIIRVYDGDTIVTNLSLPAPLNKVSVRIRGIDTPENPAASYVVTGKLGRAKCRLEAKRARAATAYLRLLHSRHGGTMTVKNLEYGAYAGRIVGDVYIGGVNVGQRMLERGYAVPYDGKSKRNNDWCVPDVDIHRKR